jgi:hypothetical protein
VRGKGGGQGRTVGEFDPCSREAINSGAPQKGAIKLAWIDKRTSRGLVLSFKGSSEAETSARKRSVLILRSHQAEGATSSQ